MLTKNDSPSEEYLIKKANNKEKQMKENYRKEISNNQSKLFHVIVKTESAPFTVNCSGEDLLFKCCVCLVYNT